METDPIIAKMQKAFERSGLTLNELGEHLGYEGEIAKKRAWNLLYRTNDPRISTVRLFAKAVGVKVKDLVGNR